MAFLDNLTGRLRSLFRESPSSGTVSKKAREVHDIDKIGFMGPTAESAQVHDVAPKVENRASGPTADESVSRLRPDPLPTIDAVQTVERPILSLSDFTNMDEVQITNRMREAHNTFTSSYGVEPPESLTLSIATNPNIKDQGIRGLFGRGEAVTNVMREFGKAFAETTTGRVAGGAFDLLVADPFRRRQEAAKLTEKAKGRIPQEGLAEEVRGLFPGLEPAFSQEEQARLSPEEVQFVESVREEARLDFGSIGGPIGKGGKAAREVAGEVLPGVRSRARHFEDSISERIQALEGTEEFAEELIGRGGGRVITNKETLEKARSLGDLDEKVLIEWTAETPVNTVDIARANSTIDALDRNWLDAFRSGDEELLEAVDKTRTKALAGYNLATATPGRATQIQNSFIRSAQETIEDIKGTVDALDGPLTDKARKTINSKIDKLKPKAAKAPRAAQDRVVSFMKMVEEFATAAKLTSPLTHAKNIVGNTLTFGVRGVEKLATGQVDKIFGTKAGWKSGAAKFFEVMKDENAASFLKEGRNIGKIPGKLGRAIRTPFRFLSAADDFQKTILRDSELHGMAFREGRELGLKGDELADFVGKRVTKPTEAMSARADSIAREFTFQEDLGPFTEKIAQVFQDIPGGRLVVPFIQTPTNIVKFYARRSPWGLLSGKNRRALLGGPGVERREAMAKIATGTAASVGVWQFVQDKMVEGEMTGAAPDNPGERDVFFAQGKRPYSMKIGNKWISYQGVQPAGLYILQAVAFEEARAKADETGDSSLLNQAMDVFGAMVFTAAEGITELPFVDGVDSVLKGISDPDRFGARALQRIATGFIPTGLRDVAKGIDPVARKPETLEDAINAAIPGRSQLVPPRVDVLGREQTGEKTGIARGLVKIVSTQKTNKIFDEFNRLEFFPSLPDRKQRGADLSDEELESFAKISGTALEERLTTLFDSEGYRNAFETQQERMIQKAVTETREEGREAVFGERIPELREVAAIRDAIDTALETAAGVDDEGKPKDVSSFEKNRLRPVFRGLIRPRIEPLSEQDNESAAEGWEDFLDVFDERTEVLESLNNISPESDAFKPAEEAFQNAIKEIGEEHPDFLEQFNIITEALLLR